MTNRYIYSKLDKNMAVFRYWQDKPREVLEMLYYDTSLGWYISEGFTREAMQPGFKFVDDKGNECEECKTLDKERSMHLNEIYIKGRSASKWFSHSVLIRMQREGNIQTDEEGNVTDDNGFFYWLEDTHINEMELKKGSKEITKLIFRDPEEFPVTNVKEGSIEVEPGDLKNLRLLGEYDKHMGKFRSKYEPIIDNLISYSTFLQELTIGIIRTYSGLRYVIAPASYLKDSKTKAEIESAIENMGHNFVWAAPDGSAIGDNFEFGIKFGDGPPPFSPEQASGELIKPIAIFTKIPKTALSGEELGLRAGETNRQSFLNALNEEQKAMNQDLIWMYGTEFDDHIFEHNIEWLPLIEVDETEHLQNLQIKFDIFKANMHIVKDPDTLLDFLDLDIEIDAEKLEQDRLQREALSAKLSKGSSDDSGESTDDQEKTDKSEEDTKQD